MCITWVQVWTISKMSLNTRSTNPLNHSIIIHYVLNDPSKCWHSFSVSMSVWFFFIIIQFIPKIILFFLTISLGNNNVLITNSFFYFCNPKENINQKCRCIWLSLLSKKYSLLLMGHGSLFKWGKVARGTS